MTLQVTQSTSNPTVKRKKVKKIVITWQPNLVKFDNENKPVNVSILSNTSDTVGKRQIIVT